MAKGEALLANMLLANWEMSVMLFRNLRKAAWAGRPAARKEWGLA